MKTNLPLVLNFTIAMLAIVNPVEKIPLWVEASKDGGINFRWRLAGLIIVSCAAILLLFLLFGHQILRLLRIDLASFKIGGGLILIHFGFSMLKGNAVDIGDENRGEVQDLKRRVMLRYQQVFIPIGVPVIAGPGAITTAIIYGSQSSSLLTVLLLFMALLAVLGVLFLTLVAASSIQRVTGEMPLKMVSRLFGIILIAIAVQFAVEGLGTLFPALMINSVPVP
jgi:multiple antibiotic resistance protein